MSTLDDLVKLGKLFINKGKMGTTRLLSEKSIELMMTDHTTFRNISTFDEQAVRKSSDPENIKESWISYRKDTAFGLGVQVKITDGIVPKGLFGWIGVTTTNLWIDINNKMFGIFLSQYNNLFQYPVFTEFVNETYQNINI
jgi:CubicO group peptidase (beta-lactamase class C family)